MAPFSGWDSTASRLEPLREAVYFLPLSSQKFLVLILLTLEGWKAESKPSGFEQGTPGLGIQHLNNKIIEGSLTQTMSIITILIIIAIITIIRLHHTIIDHTNENVILNNWKVKFKIKWNDVSIYKYKGNKYEN